MAKKLAYIGISAILLVLVSWSIPGMLLNDPKFADTIFGKILITYIVLAGITPWLYLIEKTRGKVTKRKLAVYFIGSFILAPYFLLRGEIHDFSAH